MRASTLNGVAITGSLQGLAGRVGGGRCASRRKTGRGRRAARRAPPAPRSPSARWRAPTASGPPRPSPPAVPRSPRRPARRAPRTARALAGSPRPPTGGALGWYAGSPGTSPPLAAEFGGAGQRLRGNRLAGGVDRLGRDLVLEVAAPHERRGWHRAAAEPLAGGEVVQRGVDVAAAAAVEPDPLVGHRPAARVGVA